MPVVSFLDGKQYISDYPVSLFQIIKDIYPKNFRDFIGATVNNYLFDLQALISINCTVNLIKKTDILSLDIIKNSCIYLLGYAIKKLWPHSKLGEGGRLNNKFYYDFDLDQTITKYDLELIENKMLELSKDKFDILYQNLSLDKVKKIFSLSNETYKLELLSEKFIIQDKISLYYHQNHSDFNIGVQLPNIGLCKYFKLETLSGAYWKNKKCNKMLFRIYGSVWLNKDQLKENLINFKLAKERDHRNISKNLFLYHIQKNVPGMIFWHPNGLILFRLIEQFIRDKLSEYNYQEVRTPLIMDKKIWEKSGHWDNYQESIFTTSTENRIYCIKPMNCPGHLQIFNQGLKSYRDLPYRMAEFGSCHRQESSGSLHGLMRVRSFTQDDAHIFCTEEQIESEIDFCIKMVFDIYEIFGFKKILIKLSTRPEKSIGNRKIWERAEKDLVNVLNKHNLDFEYQPGEGAFYGPKIELILKDSLNRIWQCGTIQLDFYLAERLNTFYINQFNQRQSPIIIHRAILGSLERFIGILIEEYSGNFPLWLAPIQVVVININENQISYVKKITNILLKSGIRVQSDVRNEKINVKIRDYTILRIPYIFICGEKEIKNSSITIRNRSGKNFTIYKLNYIIEKLKLEIQTRSFSQMEE